MATLLKYLFGGITLLVASGCYTAHETITICGKRYDLYKSTEWDYEQQLTSTVNHICFKKTNVIAFSYQSAGYRNNDSNLVYTVLRHQNDSLIKTTYYNEKVFGYAHQSPRYYKCLSSGLLKLSTYGHPDRIITKRSAKRNGQRLKR